MRNRHPGWQGPINSHLQGLPDDADAQTAVTISLMRELATRDAATPPLRTIAAGLPSSPRAVVDRIFWFVRQGVRFRRDSELAQGIEGWSPDIIEVLVRPVDLLTMQPAEGDCDDFSMLVASLLVAAGIPSSFVTVAADPLEPTRYSHVYVVAHLADGDVAVDASHGSEPGWEAPNRFGKRTLWRVDSMHGLGEDSQIPWFSTTTTAAAPKDVPWWQQLIFTGADIAKTRFGLPENTYVVGKDGVISRGSGQNAPAVPVTDVRGQAGVTGGASTLLIIAALAILVLIVATSRGKK